MAQIPYITITVAQDGSGDFTSIQKAINSIRDFGPAEALVKIKAGTYHEKIVIPSSKHKLLFREQTKKTPLLQMMITPVKQMLWVKK